MNVCSKLSNGKRFFTTATLVSAMYLSVSFSASIFSTRALADALPDCTSNGQSLEVNNDQVMNWKASTANQFHARAHIQGELVNIYPDKSGHHHLEVKIGSQENSTVEVVYNEEFGGMPELVIGQTTIEACGDYITSNQATSRYPASPDGAIVHWVHMSTSPRHESGYVAVNGTAYGQGGPAGSQKHRRH